MVDDHTGDMITTNKTKRKVEQDVTQETPNEDTTEQNPQVPLNLMDTNVLDGVCRGRNLD